MVRAMRAGSGYVYAFAGNPANWRGSPDDDWEIGVFTATGNETHVGTRRIDDALSDVFQSADGLVAVVRAATIEKPAA